MCPSEHDWEQWKDMVPHGVEARREGFRRAKIERRKTMREGWIPRNGAHVVPMEGHKQEKQVCQSQAPLAFLLLLLSPETKMGAIKGNEMVVDGEQGDGPNKVLKSTSQL